MRRSTWPYGILRGKRGNSRRNGAMSNCERLDAADERPPQRADRGGFDRGQSVPTIFFRASPPAEAAYEAKPRRELLSNVTMLIEAAGEAGRMDQLLALVEPLATEKTPVPQTWPF